MIRAILIAFLFSVPAFAQTWNQAESLTNLLTRTPVVGGWYSVKGYRTPGDWGSERTAQYVRGDTTTTNMGNVFAWSGGRLKFFDATNSIQHLAWWGGGTVTTDNTKSLTNAANYVSGIGGGYVKAGGGTHTFLYGGIVMPSGVRLVGDGPNSTVFDFTSATPAYDYEPVISWVGTVASTVKLYSVPTVGDRTIVLSSSVSWANGDWIQLSDTNAFSFGSRNYYKQGEFNFVYSNTGGTNISLLEPLEAAYPTATTTINKITPTVGSAEGIHFALGTKSGAVRLAYADSRSYLKDCSAAGTEEAHFWVDNCYGVQASGLTVDWDSDPSVGLNYGLVYGDSEYLQIGPGNFFRSARHGIASGGSSIPTRYCRVFNSTFGSTRQNVAGADMHGDVVESTFENCTFLSGLTLGGGRNRLLNSTVMNGRGATGVAVGECYYYDWEVRGNRFLISSFDDEAQSVWAMRFYLGAGSQSSQPASTNYWPGTWGGTSGQSIKVLDNEIQFTGVRTNGNYAIFIDEAATLAANTNLTSANFGGVFIRGNRVIPSADQAFAQLTAPGIYVETRDKVRWSVVDISDNPWIQAAGTQVRVHSGKVIFNRNTVVDQNTAEGVYVIPTVPMASLVDFEAIDNLFLRPIGSALTASSTTGRVLYRGNRVFNHGSINSSLSRFALVASDGSSSVSAVELGRNYITSTNSPTYDVYVSTTSGTLRDEYTELGGSVSTGTRSVGGGYLRAPFLANTYGSTNAITLLGQYTALPTASSYPPGLAHSAGDLWYSDGASWTNFMRSGKTTFTSLYVTNDLSASNIVATTLSLRNDGSRSVSGTPGTYPLYAYSNTNDAMRVVVHNANTGSSATAFFQASADGGLGYIGAAATNNSSGNVRARTFINSILGNGIAFDLTYPNSMDLVYTYGGGIEFARLNTNTFSLPGVTTLAPTNVPTHVAIFDADPTSTRRLLKSVTPANLKNTLAIVSTDISDSTSAGRALLTAANAAAQAALIETGFGISTNGIMARTGSGVATTRHIVGGPEIAVANGDGVSGNPTLSVNNDSITTNKVDSAFRALLGGGGGGISGIRVTDGTTDADGITNILFQPAGGSGFAVTVSDLGTQANVDFEWLYPGVLINGVGQTYGTARYNFNSATPAALTGYRNATLQTSTTNVVIQVPASYFLSTSLVGTNNSAAEFVLWTNSIPAGYIRDGGRIQLSGLLRSMNNTGSSRFLAFKLYVGSGVYAFGDNNPGSTSSSRGNYYTADIFRNGSTNIFVQAFNRVDGAPGTPSSGGTLSTTTVSGPNQPTWSASVSDLDANALPISLTVAMSVASTNYWATNVFAHITPQ